MNNVQYPYAGRDFFWNTQESNHHLLLLVGRCTWDTKLYSNEKDYRRNCGRSCINT